MKFLDSKPGVTRAEVKLSTNADEFYIERNGYKVKTEDLIREVQEHNISREVIQGFIWGGDADMTNACLAILADNLKHGRLDEPTLKMLRTSNLVKWELAKDIRTYTTHMHMLLTSETFHLPEVSVRSTMQVLDAESPRRLTLRRVRETNVQSIAPEK
jgi:hypothetical protein